MKDNKKADKIIVNIKRRIKKKKDKLLNLLNDNKDVRQLNPKYLHSQNIISIFDAVLTRTLGIPENTLTQDIVVVQTYFFKVLEDIILDGFTLNNERYVYFTASAGQIRTKKNVFIKEKLFKEHQATLMN